MDTRTYSDRREYNRAWRAANAERIRGYERAYYARNPGWRRDYAAGRYAEARAFIDGIKLASGCVDCGYAEHACALDFDHRDPELKSFRISERMQGNRELLRVEIAKCDVRCKNCHAVRTKSQGLGGRPIQIGGDANGTN